MLMLLASLALGVAVQAQAQGPPDPPPAPPATPEVAPVCYSAGSVAGAAVGTFLATVALLAVVVAVYKFYWRGRRGKHLILVKDPEAGDQYAFDNPCFRDGTPLARPPPEKDANRIDQKTRWSGWTSFGALTGAKSGEKRRALDDLCLAAGEPPAQQRLVTLRSRDFTGLGFNVCGNMRDGIFVRDVLHRGPAFESGRIQPGDRIEAIRISFRHMVFEDALTILSYASPYEVQMELGSATPTAPTIVAAGSLLRPRRCGTALATERIVHPFFRSQSSADLAQISKASLKRVQQMGVGGTRYPGSTSDEQESNEYPTLKLSSSPIHPVKENAKLEKTAPTAVVKPERVKRNSTPKEPDASPTGDTNTLSKFQKFGVRVLPDPAPRQSLDPKQPLTEAEKHQNEQNLIKEKVATNPFSTPQGHDTVDAGNPNDSSFYYDERGIDIGPVEVENVASPEETKTEVIEKHHQRSASTDDEEGPKENNVKNLLTKGFQNLKDKLHHDKRRSAGSPESPQSNKDKKSKPARQHKTSMSSDSEGLENEKSEGPMKMKLGSKDDTGKTEWKRQRNPDKSGPDEPVLLPPESGIPSEIPEEVRRAAVAARSNRKSLQASAPVAVSEVNKDVVVSSMVTRVSMSDSSSDCETGTDTMADSLGRTPKRSNKRKAPPPPAEEVDMNIAQSMNINNNNKDAEEVIKPTSDPEKNSLEPSTWNRENSSNPDMQVKHSGEPTKIITTFANLARQRNNPDVSAEDITNITIDNGNPNALFSLSSKRASDGEISGRANSAPVDSSSSGTSTMETKTVDYDNDIHVSTVNSDSDSDLERLEGDDDMFEGKRSKKGGTTIELNSSHITIHHSPSSDTMQMTTELESDSTRKAASLGDLSRLDSEQPMSILERAVSLDLGDGGTPHSSKKRKAPLPPPGDEYLNTAQDTEDGAHYRKEPRLDNAMDTFQRRRLKKSSDWGTLEEALKQTDTSSAPQKFETQLETSRMEVELSKPDKILSKENVQEDTSNLADDQKVKLSAMSQKFSENVRGTLINAPGRTNFDDDHSVPVTFVDKVENMEQSGRSSPECDHSVDEHEKIATTERVQDNNISEQKKTVLHISQEVTQNSLSENEVHTDEEIPGPSVASGSGTTVAMRKPTHESSPHDTSVISVESRNLILSSPMSKASSIVSSTPYSKHLQSPHSPTLLSSSTEQCYIKESLQSPLVTSSDAGVSNINVVTSTTQNISPPSELESNITAHSESDHFITATSIVDSTTTAEESNDNDVTWGNEIQPPELPTSPVPLLSQATSSSFPSSPSLTYITEIQVVTTTDSENDQTIGSSNLEMTPNGTSAEITSSFLQGIKKNKSDSSLSSDSIGSGGGIDDDDDDDDIEPTSYQMIDSTLEHIPRSSVTVTSIRTTASEGSRGQSGGIVTETTLNHIPGKKPKSVRPPVPPRKSDLTTTFSSSPPSMSSSTIMVEVPKIRLAETASSSLLTGGSVSQVSPVSAGKFISFSSLSPRSEGSSGRHGSSFEQWVFLDDSTSLNHHNGVDVASTSDSDNSQHPSIMNLPGLTTNRTQTVTHIILDTKHNSGGQMQE